MLFASYPFYELKCNFVILPHPVSQGEPGIGIRGEKGATGQKGDKGDRGHLGLPVSNTQNGVTSFLISCFTITFQNHPP